MQLGFRSIWADGPCRKLISGGSVLLLFLAIFSGCLLFTQQGWWIAPTLVLLIVTLIFWVQLQDRIWDLEHTRRVS